MRASCQNVCQRHMVLLNLLLNTAFHQSIYNQTDQKYFYTDYNTICIGYLINTINGVLSIPIISMKDIRSNINIKYDLIEYIPKLEKKRKLNNYLFLIRYSNLPIEMIEIIMSFY